ncbi:unnamed protein product [Caenorhabditis bovis]|uniref:Uncharacterized protein n=1 Tax=Caenorhabditis bovis TaxID=2654633 RepID=A0A8S1F5F3_9PELO|nr:unnamed protein product [Caenorhabditis bovis]
MRERSDETFHNLSVLVMTGLAAILSVITVYLVVVFILTKLPNPFRFRRFPGFDTFCPHAVVPNVSRYKVQKLDKNEMRTTICPGMTFEEAAMLADPKIRERHLAYMANMNQQAVEDAQSSKFAKKGKILIPKNINNEHLKPSAPTSNRSLQMVFYDPNQNEQFEIGSSVDDLVSTKTKKSKRKKVKNEKELDKTKTSSTKT